MDTENTARESAKPLQPLHRAEDGVIRFVANKIVADLFVGRDPAMGSLLDDESYTDAEVSQFTQLVGYSISGWGLLPATSDEDYEVAVEAAERLERSEKEEKSQGKGDRDKMRQLAESALVFLEFDEDFGWQIKEGVVPMWFHELCYQVSGLHLDQYALDTIQSYLRLVADNDSGLEIIEIGSVAEYWPKKSWLRSRPDRIVRVKKIMLEKIGNEEERSMIMEESIDQAIREEIERTSRTIYDRLNSIVREGRNE